MTWRRALGGLLLIAVLFVSLVLGTFIYQGKQSPRTNAPYVALGSSFAAGLGLGARASGSPFVCQRSVNGYPQFLARTTGLSLVDMSCSGATIGNVRHGGQMFLGPQIDAIGPDTRLVTITAGGNDVAYVGDLTVMAYKRRGGVPGLIAGQFWDDARPVEGRGFADLRAEFVATLSDVRRRAPSARILVITYPSILPPTGTCRAIGITEAEADTMRAVALKLAEVTVAAAAEANATLVDMAALSAGHDACSAAPWVNGAAPVEGAPFHPTLAGARSVARQIRLVVEKDGP